MKQKQKEFSTISRKEDTTLQSEFEKIKSEKIAKADTKVVNIKLQVGCGCGGSYEKYNVEVPINASVRNGDYFDEFKGYMKNAKKGWV